MLYSAAVKLHRSQVGAKVAYLMLFGCYSCSKKKKFNTSKSPEAKNITSQEKQKGMTMVLFKHVPAFFLIFFQTMSSEKHSYANRLKGTEKNVW